jgi:hypothetical protein
MHNESYRKLSPPGVGVNRLVSPQRSVSPSAQTATLLRTPPASVKLLQLQRGGERIQ